MSDQGKEQQTGAEVDNVIATRNFIEAHGVSLSVGLIDILRSSRIVLIGDAHTPAGERLRAGLVSSLPQLRDEGGVTGIAVELDTAYQQRIDDINADDPELEKTIADIAPVGWYPGNIAFLAEAKRLGLKTICIDLTDKKWNEFIFNKTTSAALKEAGLNAFSDAHLREQLLETLWQDRRNDWMFKVMESMTTTSDKILVLVGTDHIHKQPRQGVNNRKVIPLGMRLAEQYDSTLVKSVRPVYKDGSEHFDNLLPSISRTPTVAEVVSKEEPVMIVPDEGPIKGDPRVTATDYVAIA